MKKEEITSTIADHGGESALKIALEEGTENNRKWRPR